MDLSSIMNEGDAPVARPMNISSPDISRNRPQSTTTLPSHHPPPQPFGSSSGGIGNSRIQPSVPTLQTSISLPAHAPPQSSAAPNAVQYQSYTPHPPSASLSRASSYTQPYAQSSPSHRYASLPQQGMSHSRPSNSPTPSHHSQTPHSVRQSPLSSIVPGQGHPHHSQAHYNVSHSQPTTPLAPPFSSHQRQSGDDVHSPPHHRSFSGTSNSMMVASPAQHHPSIGNLVESPIAQHRSQSQARRTSDQLTQGEREREHSVSVSPKTRIPPRPSFGTRHSGSQQDLHSARSSIQLVSVSPADTTSVYNSGPSASANGHVAHYPSLVADQPLRTSVGSQSTQIQPGLRPQSNHDSPSMQHHQSQKMGMNHLLSPTDGPVASNGLRTELIKSHPPPPNSSYQQPAQSMGSLMKQEQQMSQHSPRTPLKRAADSDLASDPSNFQRGKRRKYTDRPIWARLAPNNPVVRDPTMRISARNGQATNGARPAERVTPSPAAKPAPSTGAHVLNDDALDLPWTMDPPLDTDLIRTRRILGPWEKSIKWVTPYPGMVKAVQDWLYVQLSGLGDVGNDPSEGAVEIEAKIGHIISKQNDERLRMPLLTATVLDPSVHDSIRFESQMDEGAHSAMNKFLNATIQASMAPGRVKMAYEHPRETDSFRVLSQAGIQALPQGMARRPFGRELRLRTTRDNKTNQVTARIVKMNIADLHIYDPTGEYDCRISINLEVNLNRPDLAPFDHLTIEPSGEKPAAPERKKDRLSYKHLAYSIDLTKVEISNNLAAKHELELEVDAKLLREQMALMTAGNPNNAFGDIVSGFIDNATFLMRQRVGE